MSKKVKNINYLLKRESCKKLKIPEEFNGYTVDKIIEEMVIGTVIVSAIDKSNSKKVVIKCIPIEYKSDSEPMIMQRLRHKNIIQYIVSFPYPKKRTRFFAIVMDKGHTDLIYYIENVDLEEKMIWHIMKQAFDAVKYLHGLSIWHRDIKPDNILVMNETIEGSLVVLSDFGTAIQVETDTYHGDGDGTSFYAAPELLERCGKTIEFKENIDCMYFTKKIKNQSKFSTKLFERKVK